MASIPSDRNTVVGFVIGLFNAAPGSDNLGALMHIRESGSLKDVVKALAARPEFKLVYPDSLSTAEFVLQLAGNLLGGEANNAAREWAIGWAHAQLAGGKDRATVIAAAVQTLQSSTNADFASARQMLQNKVDVANYYSVILGKSSTIFGVLHSVLIGVTSDPATVTAKMQGEFGGVIIDDPGYTWTLTTGVDVFISQQGVGSIASDVFVSAAGTLNAGDSLDGGTGNDVLTVYDQKNAFTLPTAITVRNVELLNLVGGAGITADTRHWEGLTAINVTSIDGPVNIESRSSTLVRVNVDQAGATRVSVGIGINTITTGTGADEVTFKGAAVNDQSYSTITDPHAGLTLVFGQAHGTATFVAAKVLVQAGSSYESVLAVATAGDGTAASLVRWFQYDGNTFVVEDNSAGAGYVNGSDTVVKLTGLVDLGTATLTAVAGVSAALTLA